MNGYRAYYNGKVWDIHADSLYAAKQAAIKIICPPRSKEHMIAIVLCETESGPVLIDPASL